MFAKEEEAYRNHLTKMEEEREQHRKEEMRVTKANLEEQVCVFYICANVF